MIGSYVFLSLFKPAIVSIAPFSKVWLAALASFDFMPAAFNTGKESKAKISSLS